LIYVVHLRCCLRLLPLLFVVDCCCSPSLLFTTRSALLDVRSPLRCCCVTFTFTLRCSLLRLHIVLLRCCFTLLPLFVVVRLLFVVAVVALDFTFITRCVALLLGAFVHHVLLRCYVCCCLLLLFRCCCLLHVAFVRLFVAFVVVDLLLLRFVTLLLYVVVLRLFTLRLRLRCLRCCCLPLLLHSRLLRCCSLLLPCAFTLRCSRYVVFRCYVYSLRCY